MKKVFCIILFALTLLPFVSQEADAQVMFVGTKMVSVKGGIPYRSKPFHTKESFTAGVEYAQFLKGGNYWSVGLDFEQNNVPQKEFFISDMSIVANGGYNLFIIGDFARTFNLYGFACISLGYELLNKGDKTLPDDTPLDKTQAFIYGGKVGSHSDIYLTTQLAVTMGLGTHFLWGTVTNTVVRPYFEGGLKVLF